MKYQVSLIRLPVKELPKVKVEVIDGNYTVDDCMERPALVLEDALKDFPATQQLFNNITLASAYLQVIVPQAHENTEQSKIVSERAQATLEQMKILEKSLSKSWFDRTYLWWTGAAAVISVVTYMVLTKATPTLVAPAAIDILKTTFTTTKDTVTATTKKLSGQVAPESTLNIFLDNPLTCMAIVGVATCSILGARASFKLFS